MISNINNQKIEYSFNLYAKECPEVKDILRDSVKISNRLPKCKSIHVPKKVVEELNLKYHQWIYLIITNFIHPVAYVKRVITIPLKLRKLIENDNNVEISIKPISNNNIIFLSCFRPVTIHGNLSHYDLCVHPIIKSHSKLRIYIKDKYFYGTSIRGRISLGKKTFERLNLESLKTYQFVADFNNNSFNNEHLFKNSTIIDFKDVIKDDKIILSKLLQDFEIKEFEEQIEVFYETRCKDSKKMKLNKNIKISKDLLRLFGMYQAEGTKTKANYLCFTNNDPNQIRYFREKFTEIFGIDSKEWRLDISTNRNKEQMQYYWHSLLKIDNLLISNSSRNSEYGTANLRINNNTSREIAQRILKLIKNIVAQNKDYCGYFISGVLSGDGHVYIENNSRVKRIELYFNANKIEEESLFYLNCLSVLGITHHNVRIHCPKNDRILAEKANKIVEEIHTVFSNVKIIPKNNIQGIGGTISIHKKSDIQKLANFELFYPNISHYNKFYKYWHD